MRIFVRLPMAAFVVCACAGVAQSSRIEVSAAPAASDDLIIHWEQDQLPRRAAQAMCRLWVGAGEATDDGGATLGGAARCEIADFGIPPPERGFSAPALALPAAAGGCDRREWSTAFAGSVAIVRGDGGACPYVSVALAAQTAGAVGLVVIAARGNATRIPSQKCPRSSPKAARRSLSQLASLSPWG